MLSAYQFEYIHTHIYIFFLHIYAIFTCYETTELLGTRFRQLFVWIFFLKEKYIWEIFSYNDYLGNTYMFVQP